jgi:hypothetical protein
MYCIVFIINYIFVSSCYLLYIVVNILKNHEMPMIVKTPKAMIKF